MHNLGRVMCLQSTGSNGCASGCSSVPPKVPTVAAALALGGCGLLMQLSHLCGLCRNFPRVWSLETWPGWETGVSPATLQGSPPWSCSSPSNKCLGNTCSTPLGHLLIILSPLLITWHGFTPHHSFLRSNIQSPPSVSPHPLQWWPLAVFCALLWLQ